VINFGVSGYGTAQEYLLVESTVITRPPDTRTRSSQPAVSSGILVVVGMITTR
jgi:hypothetical protein